MHGVIHQFDPFCPKIIGLKGMKMPDMLASRGVVIKLWPKTLLAKLVSRPDWLVRHEHW